ncbi:hypothetical protein HDU91_000103, partial [Kappamyces sp. JEL0680]
MEEQLKEAAAKMSRIEDRCGLAAESSAARKYSAAQSLLREKHASQQVLSQRVASLAILATEGTKETEKLRQEHEKELEELRIQHETAMAESFEQELQKTGRLKARIRALETQIEEENKKKSGDLQGAREAFEEREAQLRSELDSIVARMRENLEAETRRSEELEQNSVVLKLQLDKKNQMIETLETDRYEFEQKTKEAEVALSDVNNQYSLLNMEYTYVRETCDKYEARIPLLESELGAVSKKLEETTKAYESMKSQAAMLSQNLELTTSALDVTKSNLVGASEEIAALGETVERLETAKQELEDAAVQLREEMRASEAGLREEMATALAELTERLEREREEEVVRRCAAIVLEKDATIASRLKDMEALEDKIVAIRKENLQSTDRVVQDHLARETDLRNKIAELEATIESKLAKIKEGRDQIDEKNKVIHTHLNTIHARDATIKGLEVDLADLFQKMVQCDKQIRSEMQEKFHHDKAEWEAQVGKTYQAALEEQSLDLRARHELELRETQLKLKTQFQEELAEVHNNYAVKLNGNMEELAEKQNQSFALKEKLDALELKIKELNIEFQEKEDKMNTDFQALLAETNAQHRAATDQREVEYQAQQELLLKSIEAKHAEAQTELTAGHKKQIDELRNFYSISTVNAKKEAEATKANEIAKLTLQYETAAAALAKKHEDFVQAEIARITDEKDLEISDLIDDYDDAVAKLTKELESCQAALLQLQNSDRTLQSDFDALKVEFDTKSQELHRREKEMRRAGKEFDARVAKLLADVEQKTKTEKDHLKNEHIMELQMMLLEFEKAKNFLKKEIATKNQQLEDAAQKYINREPRDEDLKTIADLNNQIATLRKHIEELN